MFIYMTGNNFYITLFMSNKYINIENNNLII